MEAIFHMFEVFGRVMEEEKVWMDPDLTFDEVCRRIGSDPRLLEEYALAQTGFSGEEIMGIYRSSEGVSEREISL